MTENSKQLVQLDAGGPGSVTRTPLFGLDTEALSARMVAAGEPAFRGRQLAEAMYRQRLTGVDELTTLPKALRQRLAAEGCEIGRPRIAQVFESVDGTERYLIECQGEGGQTGVPGDRSIVAGVETVEAVWMPEGDEGETGDGTETDETEGAGKSWQRATICVSSQVGCAVNCQFCLTAKLGLQRNLTAGEIAGQVIAILDRHAVEVGRDRVNLVFMGMGEPFLNYDNFMAAVRLLVKEAGLSPQRMTVSTSGIVPGIERFAQEPAEVRPKLAISLNAPNDEVRSELMPINKKWPIETVMDAVRQVPLRSRERITFEYVLLGGVTDQPKHARDVARLVRRSGLPAKVNLIAWNPGPGIAYDQPRPGDVEAFRVILSDAGIPTFLRKPRGRDIFAACGQLKRTVEG
ncbi:MAG: 23S rRNA (adenine(2503)-C(2))-methyltransferase RlmN [Terracidiphilus sp.]|nr:23S rRNA (adenine(2503)-C(2))-methyltransferase RlmN [Terracidiphilus sp.]